ncbi:MAG: hypothetical protein Unbinned2902contig1001_7 [Prokaryotic dsDNA virus sp.]|nr:MAG: hypothetical protein Unbinned2902contig1001_7 [Prokaryotic dsDNA virus sp.]|tara:strand:- start:3542 stop:4426 length:885 start_codon:yes stop_codon:yes gene_type:complete
MANTFTTNYSLIKSEIGGDNQTWGTNLHTSLDNIDSAIINQLEDQILSGITSTNIDLAAAGSDGTISTTGDLKYFQNVKVGDKIRVSGSSSATNGTAAAPVIHTVKSKTSANSITVETQLVDDSSSTITVAKVLEPVHINSGPIVCAPLTSLSATTRAAGGTGQAGASEFTTNALKADGNVILGASASNTIEPKGKIKANLIPNADATYDLGASGSEWNNLHITGTANVDSLVADTADINGGTVDGITSLTLTMTSGSYTNPTIGSNGQGARTVSTSAPSAESGANGDIHYEYA